MKTRNSKLIMRCIGCLSEGSVSTFKIQNELLRVAFREDSLKLCYICKKLARNTELFVRAVKNNQVTVNSISNIDNISHHKIEPQPILQLQTKVLDFESHEISQNVELNIEVKLEQIDEECDDIADGSDDNPACEMPFMKHDEGKDINILNTTDLDVEKESTEKFQNKVIKKKRRKKPLDQDTNHKSQETSHILIVNITREDCMREREEMAQKNLYISAKYKCKDCIKGFIYKEIYDKHKKLHLKSNGKHKCDICNQIMDSLEKLGRHKKKHFIRYKCEACGLIRNNQSTIKDHYTSVHNKQKVPYKCPDCSKEFINSGALRRHKHYRHKKNRITCDICLKSYVTKYYLRKHIQLQHAQDNSFSEWQESRCNYKCEECGKAFSAPSLLKNHMIKHSDTRSFYCVECNKKFKTEMSLNQHLKTLPHVDYSELPLQCDQCDKRFRAKRDLATHMNRKHLGTKPYQCDKCEKGYADQWSLTEHIRYKHEGQVKPRKYPCTVCDKVFATNSTCIMHIRTHTGERPFKCTKCSASFSQSGILNTHDKLVHLKLTRDGKPKVNSVDKSRFDNN